MNILLGRRGAGEADSSKTDLEDGYNRTGIKEEQTIWYR